MSALDRRVIVSGAIAGLFFALPAAVLQRTVFADTAFAPVMVIIIFFAGALAGYGAARPRPRNALMHGAAAGVITFLGAQIVYLVATRDRSNPIGILRVALLVASLGTIGAMVAVSRKVTSE